MSGRWLRGWVGCDRWGIGCDLRDSPNHCCGCASSHDTTDDDDGNEHNERQIDSTHSELDGVASQEGKAEVSAKAETLRNAPPSSECDDLETAAAVDLPPSDVAFDANVAAGQAVPAMASHTERADASSRAEPVKRPTDSLELGEADEPTAAGCCACLSMRSKSGRTRGRL